LNWGVADDVVVVVVAYVRETCVKVEALWANLEVVALFLSIDIKCEVGRTGFINRRAPIDRVSPASIDIVVIMGSDVMKME